MMMNNKLVNKLAGIICFAICIQRLSMALGSVSWGISILLFLILFFKMKKSGQNIVVDEDVIGYYKAYAICAASFIPSIFVANDISAGVKLFFEMWLYRVMPFFMVTLFIKDKIILRKILLIVLAVFNIDCLVAVGQVILNLGSRGWGFGGNTLHLASILCVIIPMLLVVILDDKFAVKTKKFASLSIVCCFIGVLAGQSRGAWLTLAIILPLVAVKYIINRKKRVVTAFVLIGFIVGVFMVSPSLRYRVESIGNVSTDRSNISRIAVWESGINMIKDHPVVGVGLGGFREAYKTEYILLEDKIGLSHAHNNLIQIGAETGIVGLLGFIYLNGYILIRNFMEWRKNYNPYSLMILSGWLGFTVFGMFDLTIDASAIMKTLWFLLGALLMLKNSKTGTEL